MNRKPPPDKKDASPKDTPMIIFTTYSPFMVTDLDGITGPDGNALEMEPVTALCRCGKTQANPYCDGSHAEAGFSGEKDDDRTPDALKSYEGREITIHDNRGVCSHDGSCINLLPSVFKKDGKPWIDPDGAGVREIIETIEKCPSGALSYSIGSRRYQDLDRPPAISVKKDGPLEVTGGIRLKDNSGATPESSEHFTLCRCGASRNKPFCDGSHLE